MDPTSEIRLQESIAEVHRLLEKHRLLETVARRQETPKSALLEQMQHRQNLVELHRRLRALHPADVAQILESLPVEDRLVVWRELEPVQAGQALVEVSLGVRESLLEHTERPGLVAALRELDADDLAVPVGVAAGRPRGGGVCAARRARPILDGTESPVSGELGRAPHDAGCAEPA